MDDTRDFDELGVKLHPAVDLQPSENVEKRYSEFSNCFSTFLIFYFMFFDFDLIF